MVTSFFYHESNSCCNALVGRSSRDVCNPYPVTKHATLTSSEAALATAVLIHGPISRTALTARLGLSPASLTRLAKPFLTRGIIVELDDTSTGSVGRPSRPLDISPGLGRFAGVKITGDRLYAVTTDVRASMLDSAERELSGRTPAQVADAIVKVLAGMSPPFTGVGVCLGGSIRGGVVGHAPFLGWHDVAFAELLRSRLHVPVVLQNDVVALTEAERWFGYGRGLPGFVVITIGAGVGYGLVVNDQVVTAADTGLGMASHLILDHASDGHPKEAGELLTVESIVRKVSSASNRVLTYEQVVQLASDGDAQALPVVQAAADALGRLVAFATTLTMQNVAVLAGEGIGLLDVARDRVLAAIAENRRPDATPVELTVDRSGFTAWARGAAAVAVQEAMRRLEL